MACMAKPTVFFFLAATFVISCHAARAGNAAAGGGCQLSDIAVSTSKTGKVVKGQPEYEVTVSNGCAPQNGVRVSCPGGVQSVEPVDESKIRAEATGGLCLVNDGMPVAKGSPVAFTYAWKQPQDFAVAQATPRC